jgi:hypothetical protein
VDKTLKIYRYEKKYKSKFIDDTLAYLHRDLELLLAGCAAVL